MAPILFALAILSIPAFFVLSYEHTADETISDIRSHDESISNLSDMEAAFRRERLAVNSMIFGQAQAGIDEFNQAAGDISISYDAVSENIDTPGEIRALEESKALDQDLQDDVAHEILPAALIAEPGAMPAEQGIFFLKDTGREFAELSEINSNLRGSFEAKRAASMSKQSDARALSSEIMWTSIGAAVFLALIVGILSASRIVRSVRRTSDAAVEMARGDLSQRVIVEGHDELAEMGRSFNDMADSLERRSEQLESEKARIRSIHQSIGDGIIVVDRGGVIVSINPAAERGLGIIAKDMERTTNIGIPDLQAIIDTRPIEMEQMVECWEAKSCIKEDCPSHGSSDRRCWLQCGTFCYNQIQGTFRQKRDACERCDVFIKNAVITFELDINDTRFSGQAVPILDDYGQEEGKTIVLHDVTDIRRAKEEAEQSAARLGVLNSVSRAAASSLEMDSILEASLESLIGGTMADSGFIHTSVEGGAVLALSSSQGIDDSFRMNLAKLPARGNEGGCPGHVVECGEPVLENDLDQLGEAARQAAEAGFHSYLGAPLMVKRETVGVVSLVAFERDAFSVEDKLLLSMAGIKMGYAVENANLYLKTLEQARREKAISEIAATLSASVDVENNFDEFIEIMHKLVDFNRLGVLISESDGASVKVITSNENKPPLVEAPNGLHFISGTAIEWVLKNKRPVICDDISKDTRFKERLKLAEDGLKSQMVIPLISKGQAVGSLNMVSTSEAAYNGDTISRLQPVVDQLAMAIANQKLFNNIAEAKNEWETTFDAASEGIVMVSKDHRITRVNRTAAALLGGEVEDILDHPCYKLLHKSGTVPDSCLMKQAYAEKTTACMEQENEDGSVLEMIVDPVYDAQGAFVGAVHFLRDITEARKLRQQLVQSEKMVAVGQLVAGVAHEINNPLTGVMGYAQLLQTRDIDDRARKDAESISREAERATKIVQHLLSFARTHQPERITVDINSVLRNSIDLKVYELKVNNIQIEPDLDAGIPLTTADPHQLQQVFLNMINNSEQAMLDDRGSGLLRISTRLVDDNIHIVFADNGPGIPEESRDRIFEPFFTTKDVGRGTGLGLSVCYGVVTDHGGRIFVEPTAGQGATFVIELPLTVAALTKEENVEEEQNSSSLLGKILLVDDEEAIRSVLLETLSRAGHEVETARNGEVALRMLQQKHYDCVVSDVKMPGMDGPTLHQAIKAIDPAVAGTFIFISGDTVSSDTRSYLETVDNPKLAKPFEIVMLEKALQEMLAATAEGTD